MDDKFVKPQGIWTFDTVLVYTQDHIQTLIDQGGTGKWKADFDRLSACENTIICAKGGPNQGAGLLVAKNKRVRVVDDGRKFIPWEKVARIHIPNLWPKGNQYPLGYVTLADILDESKLVWTEITQPHQPTVDSLTVEDIRKLLGKMFHVEPSQVNISISV